MSSQSRVAVERVMLAWSGLGRTCGRLSGLQPRGGGQATRGHHVLTYIVAENGSRAPLWFLGSGGNMQTQARAYSTSGPYDFTKTSYCTKATNGVENSETDPHAEEQEREHEFTPMRDRDMLERLDSQAHHMSLDEVSASCMQASEAPSAGAGSDNSAGQHHNSTGGVSLSGVMQSNVPEPFQSTVRGSPTHMNMPGGGSRRQDKYLAGHIKDVHPSRQYSTAARLNVDHNSADTDNLYAPYSDMQGPQGDIGLSVQDLAHLENPCPQGIQGEDCEHFKQWLNNCVRFGHVGCEDNLTAFRSGRKTLPEIFAEQEMLIAQAARRQHHLHQNYTGSVRHFSSGPPPKGHAAGSESVSGSIEGAAAEVTLSQKDKLKRAVKEYGGTVIVFHVTISLMSLGTAYLAVSSGLDVVGLLQKIGVGQAIIESRLATGTGTFVVAYAVHKVFAPVRIATTLTCTPFIVRYLRRIGFLKPPKI